MGGLVFCAASAAAAIAAEATDATSPTYVGIALIITAVATLITAVATLRRTGEVRHEVRTMNESTQGELAAEDETRRIVKIPRAKRTKKEQRHVDDAPPPDPPQGPDR